MRILHATPHYIPSFAGITTVIREISAVESAQGNDVTVICHFPWKPWKQTDIKTEIIENIKVIRVKNYMYTCKNRFIGRFLNRFLLPFNIFSSLVSTKIDCVHIAGIHHLAYGVLFWAKVNRVPVFLSLYGEELRVFEDWETSKKLSLLKKIKLFYRFIIYKIFFSCVDDVSCSSRSLAVRLNELNLKSESELIFNGVNLDKITIPPDCKIDGLKVKYGIPLGKYIIGSVGGISHRKGYDILIDVFSHVCKHKNDAVLAIVGGGDIDSLKTIAKSKGVLDKIVFLGAVTYEQLLQIYPLFDIYVQLPRNEEGVSQTAVEAAVYGKAVILSDCGAMRDSVNDGVSGFIFPVHELDKIADKIIQLYENRNLSDNLGKQGEKWVRDNFSYAKIANQYINAFHKIVNK